MKSEGQPNDSSLGRNEMTRRYDSETEERLITANLCFKRVEVLESLD
jgi:hypothetical protein